MIRTPYTNPTPAAHPEFCPCPDCFVANLAEIASCQHSMAAVAWARVLDAVEQPATLNRPDTQTGSAA